VGVGPDFDWVQARMKCSAVRVFGELKHSVERDVITRNTGDHQQRVHFELTGDAPTFTVYRYLKGVPSSTCDPHSVSFSLGDDSICAKLSNGKELRASLTLNSQGHCVFKLDDQELEPWQFRMKALEQLFF